MGVAAVSLAGKEGMVGGINVADGMRQDGVQEFNRQARLQRDAGPYTHTGIMASLAKRKVDLFQVLAHRLLRLDYGTGRLERNASHKRVASRDPAQQTTMAVTLIAGGPNGIVVRAACPSRHGYAVTDFAGLRGMEPAQAAHQTTLQAVI